MNAIIETSGRTDVDAANEVLRLLTGTTQIERRTNGWYVTWTRYNGEQLSRRWSTRGQDFYPPWYRQWGHGGTTTTALANLIRWCQGKPVLPLSTWRYWTGERVALSRENGPQIVETLFAAGYPEVANCVLCGREIIGGMDWWSLDKVSGPCCDMRSGCQQKR